MLKKWLRKILPKQAQSAEKEVIPFSRHHISGDMISFAAEKVVKRLSSEGFEAYVVGGAVRDLLLGVEPKDYDIATNATPEQVCKLFRRSRIIGRRFQIVHVFLGPETIEVTTFRGGRNVQQNASGRIMKDNTYGSIGEDAMRRDFTCNALYFNPISEEILDFHHGVGDVAERKLVMIGNPAERYQEDPIRILRAIRLSGKLGFTIDEKTAEPVGSLSGRLKNEPVARLFDEIMKILFSGHAQKCIAKLNEFHIDENIHPLLAALKSAEHQENSIVLKALKNTDQRLKEDKSVSVGFVLAALLWPNANRHWQHNMQQGMKPIPALSEAISTLKETIEKGWGVPQRFSSTMREIWQFQPQFQNMRGSRPHKLLAQPRFRAAYDFLVLRGQVGEVSKELVQWWTDFQHASPEKRAEMSLGAQAPADAGVQKRKRRRRKKKAAPKSDTAA